MENQLYDCSLGGKGSNAMKNVSWLLGAFISTIVGSIYIVSDLNFASIYFTAQDFLLNRSRVGAGGSFSLKDVVLVINIIVGFLSVVAVLIAYMNTRKARKKETKLSNCEGPGCG